MSLMQYIPTQPQPQPGDQSGAGKYHGAVAEKYDEKRQGAKWQREQSIIEDMLGDLADGSWVIDAPCGTGRFFEYYQRRGFIVRAFDRSPDMIKQATAKIAEPSKVIGDFAQFAFICGDLTQGIAAPKDSVDAVVCCRFTRWLIGDYGPEAVHKVIKDLQRVARKKVIITARTKHVRAPKLSVSYELIKGAISEGWKIHRDEPGADNAANLDENYRIIELRPV